MFISLVPWNDLLERLNPTEDPFSRTALLVEFQIEPAWLSSLRVFPGSPVVLTNFPGIVGCICGDDCRTLLHFGSLKRFEGWHVGPLIMDICRCNHAGKGETSPINQGTQFVPFYFLIAIITSRSPFRTKIHGRFGGLSSLTPSRRGFVSQACTLYTRGSAASSPHRWTSPVSRRGPGVSLIF